MKTGIKTALFFIIALCLYLLFWPVPLSPKAWDVPEDRGFTGDFAANTQLENLNYLSIGDRHGPEDVAARITEAGLRLYVSSQNGDIIEIDPATDQHRLFAQTGGVPLGLEFDLHGNLLVADAHKGLVSISSTGQVSGLSDHVNGTPILYADDVDIGPDGIIYFTDASTKFGAKASGTTLKGSVMEIFEHARTGRILAYDPSISETYEIASNISPDGTSLLYNETGEYRLMRLFIRGPRLGESEIVYDNFPGFPDNINPAPALADGTPTYFIGLVSPRSASVDGLSDYPFMRKVIWRLPAFMRPKAAHYSHLIRIDRQGHITGAISIDGNVYLSSLEAGALGYKKLKP